MMDDLNWNRHKSILAIDSKTLRDISGMLVREGKFKVLPDILERSPTIFLPPFQVR